MPKMEIGNLHFGVFAISLGGGRRDSENETDNSHRDRYVNRSVPILRKKRAFPRYQRYVRKESGDA